MPLHSIFPRLVFSIDSTGGAGNTPRPVRTAAPDPVSADGLAALDAEQARLASGPDQKITQDAFVKDRMARELPANASPQQKQALQSRLEQEYASYNVGDTGLGKRQFRSLMEDRAVAGWDTHMGAAGHITDLSDADKQALGNGISRRGDQIKDRQATINTWLATPAGKTWAQTTEGKLAVGKDGKLAQDGLEGPLTRSGLRAMYTDLAGHQATAAAAKVAEAPELTPSDKAVRVHNWLQNVAETDPRRAKVQAWLDHQVKTILDAPDGAEAKSLVDKLGTAHIPVEHLLPDAGQRVALLHKLADHGGTPAEKAAVAASLVRSDIYAGGQVDGGSTKPYAWRALMDDQPSAAALANQFTPQELANIRHNQPEYFRALDDRSKGEASKLLGGGHAVMSPQPQAASVTPPWAGMIPPHSHGFMVSHDDRIAMLGRMDTNGASPWQKAHLGVTLLRDDMAARGQIDAGGDPKADKWRGHFNDKASATALVQELSVPELHYLQRHQSAYFQALDSHAGGAAADKLKAAAPATPAAAATTPAATGPTPAAVTPAPAKPAAAQAPEDPRAAALREVRLHVDRVERLAMLNATNGDPAAKAHIAAQLIHSDLKAGREIDGGAHTDSNYWRSLMNDQPSATALANALTLHDLQVLKDDRPEYFEALNSRSAGAAQTRLDAQSAPASTSLGKLITT